MIDRVAAIFEYMYFEKDDLEAPLIENQVQIKDLLDNPLISQIEYPDDLNSSQLELDKPITSMSQLINVPEQA